MPHSLLTAAAVAELSRNLAANKLQTDIRKV
ncbi:hypothetical protein SBC1_43770 (plasmid) [Caballeronia sp. SBC1]|nr:hypothetical protein SBC1_43770 [Caballeronia sp. SBC1]